MEKEKYDPDWAPSDELLDLVEAALLDEQRTFDESAKRLKKLNIRVEKLKKLLGKNPLQEDFDQLDHLMKCIEAKMGGVAPRPGFVINRAGQCVHFHFINGAHHSKYINEWITLYIDPSDEEKIVGCMINYPVGVYSYDEVPEEYKL